VVYVNVLVMVTFQLGCSIIQTSIYIMFDISELYFVLKWARIV